MVHNTTCKVPYEVWCAECRELLTFIPALAPEAKAGHKVLKTNSIKYKGNTYSLPIGTYRGEDTRVYLSEEGGSLLVKDVDDNLIAKHTIPAGKGQTVIKQQSREGYIRQRQ